MSANRWGERFQITSFGESHGTALGVVIDGCPAGVRWDEPLLLREMDRRRPGGAWVSGRQEPDRPELLSGVFDGRTLGTPIAMIVRNQDARSEDYAGIKPGSRVGHADDVWKAKFQHSDPRGGGRSSGRETLSRVLAGSVARMVLQSVLPKFKITGFARKIGPYDASDEEVRQYAMDADSCVARFPSKLRDSQVQALLETAKAEGRSYGGVAEIWLDGLPGGLGQPVFHKIKADLAAAFMSLGATAGVELGDGWKSVDAEGSEFHAREGSDRYGGIRGGITTGERVVLRVAFKATSSVLDVAKKGRHDPCIVPRAIPVLEAMAALVVVDHWLWARTDRMGER